MCVCVCVYMQASKMALEIKTQQLGEDLDKARAKVRHTHMHPPPHTHTHTHIHMHTHTKSAIHHNAAMCTHSLSHAQVSELEATFAFQPSHCPCHVAIHTTLSHVPHTFLTPSHTRRCQSLRPPMPRARTLRTCCLVSWTQHVRVSRTWKERWRLLHRERGRRRLHDCLRSSSKCRYVCLVLHVRMHTRMRVHTGS